MLGVLLKQQFLALYTGLRTGRRKNSVATPRSPLSAVLILGVLGFCAIYFAFAFFGLFTVIFAGLTAEDAWLGFSLMGILIFLIDFVMTIFTAKSQLFEAKDNDLLLSLPIRPRDILLSRMLMILFTDYLFVLIVAVPVYIAWLASGGFSIGGMVCFLLTSAVMPFLALSLSCLVGWVLSLISAHLKNAALINSILSFTLLALYIALCMSMQSISQVLLTNATRIAPFIRKYLYPFYCLGDACANGNFLSALIYILVMVLPFVLTCYILSRTFIGLLTRKQGGVRRAYREASTRVRPLMVALIGREFRRLISSTSYLINACLGVVMMPVLGIGCFFLRDSFVAMAEGMGLAPNIGAPLIAIAGISMIGSMVFFTAPSVSLEHQTIYDIKALPLSGHSFLLAKVYMQLLIVIPVSLLSSLLCIIALPCSFVMGVLLLVCPPVFHLFFALVGLLMNIAFPRFDWENETAVVKQSLSVTLTMLINMIFGMLAVGVGAAVVFFLPVIPAWVVILGVTCIPALASVAMLWYLRARGDRILINMG